MLIGGWPPRYGREERAVMRTMSDNTERKSSIELLGRGHIANG